MQNIFFFRSQNINFQKKQKKEEKKKTKKQVIFS